MREPGACDETTQGSVRAQRQAARKVSGGGSEGLGKWAGSVQEGVSDSWIETRGKPASWRASESSAGDQSRQR